MTSNIPASLTYGTVTGRFLLAYSDGDDVDTNLDFVAAKGTVLFTPSAPYIVNTANDLTFMPATIECTLNNEGYLIGPDGGVGVKLLGTNIQNNNPAGWTWRVDFRLTDQTDVPTRGVASFSFELPVGTTLDLSKATPIPAGNGVYYSANGPKGDTGAAGKSAYELAVIAGFTGTQSEWLQSLPGKSAYQIAVTEGFTGTAEEWLDTLVGPQGPQGAQGPQGNSFGDSAYVVATQNGFIGTEEEWLQSLVGQTGATGPEGPQGEQGPRGYDGLSAYQVYAQPYIQANMAVPLNETQWLASLKGAQGDPGLGAYDVYVQVEESEGRQPLDFFDWAQPRLDGKSAYEVASQYASYASEAAWVASLKGETGPAGPKPFTLITEPYSSSRVYKVDEAVNYDGQVYVCLKQHSSVLPTTSNPAGGPYWFLTLQRGFTGPQGPQGAPGAKGDKGDTGAASTVEGPAGKSAYEAWVESYNGLPRPYATEQAWATYGLTNDYTYAKEELGFTGTRQEWLDTLIGPAGPAGSSGGNGETANFILNGGLDFWQRGSSFTIAANASAFTADRWKVSGSLAKTVTKTADSLDYRSPNKIRLQANQSTVGKFLQLETTIESSEAAILVGEKVVLSFDVKWTGGTANQSDFYVAYATATAGADNWTTFTPTNFGAFNSNEAGTLEFNFDVPATAKNGLKIILKSTYETTSDLIDVQLGAFMLEVSEYNQTTSEWSGASAFRRREKSIASELLACQRYFTSFSKTAADVIYALGVQVSSNGASVPFQMPAKMRTNPAVTISGLRWVKGTVTSPVTAATVKAGGDGSIVELLPVWTAASGATGDAGALRSSTTTSSINFDAEI